MVVDLRYVKGIPLHKLTPDAFSPLGYHESQLTIDMLYRRVAWLRRAVDVRAEALGSMPFCIYTTDGTDVQTEAGAIDDGGYEVLQGFGWSEFLNYLEGDMVLYGASYFIPISGTRTRRVYGFKRLHPASMRPDFDTRTGELLGFKRSFNNQQEYHPADTVGFIWLPNRNGETGHGQSLASTALASAQMIYNMDMYGQLFFERGAIKPTVLTIEGFNNLQEVEQQRVKSWFERTLNGIRNAFSILPVGTQTSIQTLGTDIGDLTVPALTDAKRQDISTAMGIPQSLLFSNASNYATARQDDLHFYDKTIIPEAMFLADKLNQQLFDKFRLGHAIKFEADRLDVYQQLQLERANVVKSLIGADTAMVGIITREEARAYLGYDTVPAYEEVEEMEEEGEDETPAQPNDDETMGVDVQTQKYLDELDVWQRMALNRYKHGKAQKALDFTADDLPTHVVAMVKNALAVMTTMDEVKVVFADVRGYLCHNS